MITARIGKTARIVGLLLVAAAVAAWAAQDAYKLVRVAKEGDAQKYKVLATMNIAGMDIVYSASFNEKVTKVDEQGNITVESSVIESKLKMGEQEFPTEEAGHSTFSKSKPNGELLEVNGEGIDDSALRRSHLTLVVVPTDEIKIGQKWSYEAKADKVNGNTAGKGDYEVVGVEKIGSDDAVAIKFTYTETSGADPASAEGKVWLSPKDGSMFKLEAQMKKAPIPEAGGAVDMKVTVERA